MIDPNADWPGPTFAEFREILLKRPNIRIEPPPKNNIYRGQRQITVFVRTADNGQEFDWIAFHNDDELLSRGMVLNACRNLHTMPEVLDIVHNLRRPPTP